MSSLSSHSGMEILDNGGRCVLVPRHNRFSLDEVRHLKERCQSDVDVPVAASCTCVKDKLARASTSARHGRNPMSLGVGWPHTLLDRRMEPEDPV